MPDGIAYLNTTNPLASTAGTFTRNNWDDNWSSYEANWAARRGEFSKALARLTEDNMPKRSGPSRMYEWLDRQKYQSKSEDESMEEWAIRMSMESNQRRSRSMRQQTSCFALRPPVFSAYEAKWQLAAPPCGVEDVSSDQ